MTGQVRSTKRNYVPANRMLFDFTVKCQPSPLTWKRYSWWSRSCNIKNSWQFGTCIPDGEKFVSLLQEHCKNVKVISVDETPIKEVHKYVPEKMEAFKGTMKINEVVLKRNRDSLEVRSRTCSACEGYECKHYSLGLIDLVNCILFFNNIFNFFAPL